MTRLVFLLALVWSFGAVAESPTKQAEKLSQEASQLLDQARREEDPTKAGELLRRACDTWKAAYDLSKRLETRLSLGLCYSAQKDYPSAAAELRIFLALAPSKHPGRNAAQESLTFAERKIKEAKDKEERDEAATRPALVVVSNPLEFKGEVKVQEPAHPWRKPLAITGGALGGVGVIAAFVVRGLIQGQEEDLPTRPLLELEH